MNQPGKTNSTDLTKGPVILVTLMALISIAMVVRLATMEDKIERASDIPFTPRDYSVSYAPSVETPQPSRNSSVSVSASSTESRANSDGANLRSEGAYLLNRYNELKSFYRTEQFEYYGFAQSGPYNDWLTGLQAWADEPSRSYFGSITAGDLIMLGMEYLSVGDPHGTAAFLDSCVQYQIQHDF